MIVCYLSKRIIYSQFYMYKYVGYVFFLPNCFALLELTFFFGFSFLFFLFHLSVIVSSSRVACCSLWDGLRGVLKDVDLGRLRVMLQSHINRDR